MASISGTIPPDIARRLQTLGFSPTWEGYQQWLAKDQGSSLNPGSNGPGQPGVTFTNPPAVPPPSGGGGGPTIYNPPGTGGSTGGGGSGSTSGPSLTGGGGSTTNASGGSTGGSMEPYIKSVTTTPGAGGNNDALISRLIASLTQSSSAANQAGLAQYTNLLNAVKGGSKRAMQFYKQAGQQIEGYGASQKADIEEARQKEYGETTQDLIGRGLGNTTITPTMLGGVNQRAQRSQIQLGDSLAALKSGLSERTGGMKLDTTRLLADSILSRQNQGPDMGMILNLLQSLGGTGGGSGARIMR